MLTATCISFTHPTFPLHSLSVLNNFLNSATTSSSQPHYLSTISLPDQSNPPSTLPLILTNMHCNIISFNARSLLPKLDDLLSIVHLHSPDMAGWLHSDITYAELSFPIVTHYFAKIQYEWRWGCNIRTFLSQPLHLCTIPSWLHSDITYAELSFPIVTHYFAKIQYEWRWGCNIRTFLSQPLHLCTIPSSFP